MSRIKWIATIAFLLAGTSQAQSVAPGRSLFLDVDGHRLRVELGSTEATYLLDPDTGQQLPRYSVEDGIAIAEALEDEGLESRLFDVLLGTRFGAPREPVTPRAEVENPAHTLFLDLEGTVVNVRLADSANRYALDPVSGARLRRFSVADAKAIHLALEERGFGMVETLETVLALELPDAREAARERGPKHGARNPATEAGTVLAPPCGQCRNGRVCYPEGQIECCDRPSGLGCQKCRLCYE